MINYISVYKWDISPNKHIQTERVTIMSKVVKFGGSSLADAKQFKKVADIIHADPERCYVVPSAPGKRYSDDIKVTDMLYTCYDAVQNGEDFDKAFAPIKERFNGIISDLGLTFDLSEEFQKIGVNFKAAAGREYAASRGEYLNGMILANYLGFDFIDAAKAIFFTNKGHFDDDITNACLGAMLDKAEKAVIPGFYGAMPDGRVKTFSRGGSDITGALAAAALDADVYENWTDVSGILMADPRIVPDPQPIGEVTYDELRELSYAGAQVLHEGTIQPVREKGIPLNIRNTNAPEDRGTFIQEEFATESDPNRVITGITGKKDFSIITMFKRGMTSQVGVLRKMLSVLERHKISVDFVPNGIDNVSLVMPTATIGPKLYTILGEIQQEVQPDRLEVLDDIAIVAAVGHRMAFRPGVSGKIFAALGEAGINIRMINQGPDELNIIFGVDNRDFAEAIRVLYNSFAK